MNQVMVNLQQLPPPTVPALFLGQRHSSGGVLLTPVDSNRHKNWQNSGAHLLCLGRSLPVMSPVSPVALLAPSASTRQTSPALSQGQQ